MSKPVTVFLTIGSPKNPTFGVGRQLSEQELKAVGIPFKNLPASFSHGITQMAIWYTIAVAFEHKLKITSTVEATQTTNARYIGVRLEPDGSVDKRNTVP